MPIVQLPPTKELIPTSTAFPLIIAVNGPKNIYKKT
jgi:hypothetical protein